MKLQWLFTAWLLTTLIWRKISCFFVGKNREMVDKESMAGDGLWQNCNNTDGWVQDYREDEGSTLYLLRRSNEIRFLWMLHDRFDRWGLGIASSSSAANRENPGRRWRSPPLIPRNTKDYLPYNTQSKIPRNFVFEGRSKLYWIWDTKRRRNSFWKEKNWKWFFRSLRIYEASQSLSFCPPLTNWIQVQQKSHWNVKTSRHQLLPPSSPTYITTVTLFVRIMKLAELSNSDRSSCQKESKVAKRGSRELAY